MWTLPHAALFASVGCHTRHCLPAWFSTRGTVASVSATRGPVSGCQCGSVLCCHTRLVYWIASVVVLLYSHTRPVPELPVTAERASPPVLLHDAQCHGTPEPRLIATRRLCLIASVVVYCVATHGLCTVLPAWQCTVLPHAALCLIASVVVYCIATRGLCLTISASIATSSTQLHFPECL